MMPLASHRMTPLRMTVRCAMFLLALNTTKAVADSIPLSYEEQRPQGDATQPQHVARVPKGYQLQLYVSLGIQANCSDQFLDDRYAFDDRRGGILVLRESDGKAHWETFASGLRNLWATPGIRRPA